ncbi:MAG: hypothetical protein JWP89_996 [Schlesneria sp.]|nr:hypothetical protein [Schlesneria sp.]
MDDPQPNGHAKIISVQRRYRPLLSRQFEIVLQILPDGDQRGPDQRLLVKSQPQSWNV